jgi:two-component system sensor histidine kinase YesM
VRISAGVDESGTWIEVADDGVGIVESKLARLREMLDSPPAFEQLGAESGDSRSIGIYNVHARITLFYGKPYGIEAFSEGEGEGATIRLRLPAARTEQTMK